MTYSNNKCSLSELIQTHIINIPNNTKAVNNKIGGRLYRFIIIRYVAIYTVKQKLKYTINRAIFHCRSLTCGMIIATLNKYKLKIMQYEI